MFKKLIILLRNIFLGYSTPKCVGLEVSSNSIKIVELVDNSLILKNYRIKDINAKQIIDSVSEMESFSDIISTEWLNFKTNKDHVAIALPYSAVIVKEIIIPKQKNQYMFNQELRDFLVGELGTDEIDYDYTIIENLGDDYKLKVVIAKKERLEEYQALVQMSALKVAVIDVEQFAVGSLFEQLLKVNFVTVDSMLIDIATNYIRAYFCKNGNILHFTEIATNYVENTDITSSIAVDIEKIIQMTKSSLIVDKKIMMLDNYRIYLSGDKCIHDDLILKLSPINKDVFYVDQLLTKFNRTIPQHELVRLMTPISLAAWGHKIAKN